MEIVLLVVMVLLILFVLVATPFIAKIVLSGHPERNPDRDKFVIRTTQTVGVISVLIGIGCTLALIHASNR